MAEVGIDLGHSERVTSDSMKSYSDGEILAANWSAAARQFDSEAIILI